MRLNKLFLSFVCLTFSLSSCVSSKKDTKSSALSQEQMEQMEQALSLMKKKDFIKAGALYDQLSVSLKDSSTKILMLFNAGVSYKEAGECKKALSRQRSVLDHSLKIPDFKSRALLELSYIYECLDKPEMTLLTLKDLEKFRTALPWAWNHILYPARLSIAFSRLGNKSQADKYKSRSLEKILEYKRNFTTEKDIQEKVSQIFYLMGRSYVKKDHLKAPTLLQSFFYHQLFLLQSLFLKDKIWSKLAEQELNLLFNKLTLALSQTKEKEKYTEHITEALKTGKIMIEKEKQKKWTAFYNKKSQLIVNLLSK
ncbi:MAG: hypothetical protein OXN83_05205 [Oligoflexia bacterium]|nr:hypothetical protein [Oligoflexia bacterium]